MSFFGFDTALPRDRAASPPQLDDEPDDALDAKIRGLALGAREDVEIYTWGGDGYDGLGDLLDEGGDELNDDTFGVADVGRDFDFAGQTNANAQAHLGLPAAAPRKANDAAFASTLDDFWGLPPSLPPRQEVWGAPPPSAPKPPAVPQSAPFGQARTLEEVEAELRRQAQPRPDAAFQQQQQQQPQSQPQQQQHRPQGPATPTPRQPGAPLTLEEVEAEMRANAQRASAAAAPPQSQPPPQPMQQQQQQQQQQQPPQQMPASQAPPQMQQGPPQLPGFPPLGAQPPMPTGPGHFPPLGAPLDGPDFRNGAPSGLPRGMPPAAAAMHAAAERNAAARAQHMAQLRAMLDALPAPVRDIILRLPPHAQFASLEGVVAQFPGLLRPDEQEAASRPAMGVLEEIERAEMRLARRAMKIQAMSNYNNLMTLSDKDFITRIQVSGLVTQDPYADDFYAHIYFQLRGPGAGAAGNPGLMGAAAASGDKAPPRGPAKGRKGRSGRDQAMARMQAQVERIVQNRKERSEKAAAGAALEGALGRVGTSSAKAPRQMLQVDARSGTPTPGAKKAAADGVEEGAGSAQDAVRAALQGASLAHEAILPDGKRPPLGRHVVLRILEKLYDTLLALEQLRRSVPGPAPGSNEPEAEAMAAWTAQQTELVATLWSELRVLEPLEVSDPHPFISLLSSVKGKRILPRALRHLSQEQILTALTLVVASFDTLDVVRQAAVLDLPVEGQNDQIRELRKEVVRQTDAFGTAVVPAMLGLMATAPMRIVSGMLALFVERNDLIRVAQTKPGIAFLTIFLSRAETLRQGGAAASGVDAPTADEATQWSEIFGLLFSRLTTVGVLPSLFPSTRVRAALPFGTSYYAGGAAAEKNVDAEDEPVWNLMAALAVSSTMAQQQILVQELKDKILENVFAAKEWAERTGSAGEGDLRIRNVNLLLHALNLDATQITV